MSANRSPFVFLAGVAIGVALVTLIVVAGWWPRARSLPDEISAEHRASSYDWAWSFLERRKSDLASFPECGIEGQLVAFPPGNLALRFDAAVASGDVVDAAPAFEVRHRRVRDGVAAFDIAREIGNERFLVRFEFGPEPTDAAVYAGSCSLEGPDGARPWTELRANVALSTWPLRPGAIVEFALRGRDGEAWRDFSGRFRIGS